MAINSNFPSGKATRANFRAAWRWLTHNGRSAYVNIQNTQTSPLYCKYLGSRGVTLDASSTTVVQLRRAADYSRAIDYYNHLQSDILAGKVRLVTE